MNIRYIALSIIMLLSGANYLCAMEYNYSANHSTENKSTEGKSDKSGKEEVVDEDITLVCSDGNKMLSKSEFESIKKFSVTLKNCADDFESKNLEYHLPGSLLIEDIDQLIFFMSLIDSCNAESYISIMQKHFVAEKLSRLLYVSDILAIDVFLEANTKALANKLQEPECMTRLVRDPNYIRSLQLNRNIEELIINQLIPNDSLILKFIEKTENFFGPELGFIKLIQWSPNHKKAATVSAGDNNVIRIWDRESRTQLFELKENTEPIASIKWNDDGTQLAAFTVNSTVYLWNIEDGSQIKTNQGEPWKEDIDSIVDTRFTIEQVLVLIRLEKNGVTDIKNHPNLIRIFNSLPPQIKDAFDPLTPIGSAIRQWQHIGTGNISPKTIIGLQQKNAHHNNPSLNLEIDEDNVPVPAPAKTSHWFTPTFKKAILYAGILAGGYALWKYSGITHNSLKLFV